MQTRNGNNGNNRITASITDGWFSDYWEPWRIYGKGGDDTLTGGRDTDTLYGDEGNDSLRGGGHDDYLYGGSENDSLYGESGRDVLYGGSGDDLLDGGSSNDSMYGGLGQDEYYVDSTTDQVIEYFNEGTDLVFSSVNDYTLGENLENLVLVNNSGAITGYGNDLDNILAGNSAANTLNGRSGNDYLFGFNGNDTLIGGSGSDTLYGGEGADTFVFYSPSEGIDTIVDWESGDLIRIYGAAFGVSSSSEISSKILYNQNTGALTTSDGTQFVTLANHPLTSDIGIILF